RSAGSAARVTPRRLTWGAGWPGGHPAPGSLAGDRSVRRAGLGVVTNPRCCGGRTASRGTTAEPPERISPEDDSNHGVVKAEIAEATGIASAPSEPCRYTYAGPGPGLPPH